MRKVHIGLKNNILNRVFVIQKNCVSVRGVNQDIKVEWSVSISSSELETAQTIYFVLGDGEFFMEIVPLFCAVVVNQGFNVEFSRIDDRIYSTVRIGKFLSIKPIAKSLWSISWIDNCHDDGYLDAFEWVCFSVNQKMRSSNINVIRKLNAVVCTSPIIRWWSIIVVGDLTLRIAVHPWVPLHCGCHQMIAVWFVLETHDVWVDSDIVGNIVVRNYWLVASDSELVLIWGCVPFQAASFSSVVVVRWTCGWSENRICEYGLVHNISWRKIDWLWCCPNVCGIYAFGVSLCWHYQVREFYLCPNRQSCSCLVSEINDNFQLGIFALGLHYINDHRKEWLQA